MHTRQVELTDGVNTVFGMEYKPVKQLSQDTKPGLKVGVLVLVMRGADMYWVCQAIYIYVTILLASVFAPPIRAIYQRRKRV